jgi:hypothetical protein
MRSEKKINWIKSIPVRYNADVAVIGGGIAGFSAACSAARSGARVILVERFGVAGGNATSGGVASFCGHTKGQGEVFDTIVKELDKYGAIAPYVPDSSKARVIDHEILAVIMQEMLLERKVKVLFHTRFVDVIVENGEIKACLICGKSGPEAIEAKQFIDCTGEAEVAYAGGFETVKGRDEDGIQLPMSLMFFVRHVNEEDAMSRRIPDGYFEAIKTSDELPMTSIWPNGPGSNAIKIKIPMFDSTDTERITAAEITGRRRMMEVLNYFQKVEKRNWILDHCSPIIGIREGRRVVGDYILRLEDLRAGREFVDAIAVGTFYLDGHKPDDDKRTYILNKDDLDVPPYQIPYRCLLVKDSKNLMAAGRCFSADQLALSSARVMTTGSMLGQAAGIAAALAVEKGSNPRDLDPLDVRRIVEARGANLNIMNIYGE